LQQAFRRLAERETDRVPRELADAFGLLPSLLGELILDPKGGNVRKMAQEMRRMAFHSGIRTRGTGWAWECDDCDNDGVAPIPAGTRCSLVQTKAVTCSAPPLNWPSWATIWGRKRLMNAAAVAEQGNYYFQIPMRAGDLTAEAKLFYHVNSTGYPQLDKDNITLELLLPPRTWVTWRTAWRFATAKCRWTWRRTTTPSRGFVQRHLPALLENIQRIGYMLATPPAACGSQKDGAADCAPAVYSIGKSQRTSMKGV